MNALAIPEIQTLPVMRYKDQPVVTTTMLAVLYGCKQRSIRDNFRRNRGRFEEGKHFIRLEGQALRDFQSIAAKSVNPFAPTKVAVRLNLWTARGAARHAKMLNTEKAWEVFEKMEDCYFNRAEAKSQPAAALSAPALSAPVTPAGDALTPMEFERLLEKKIILTGKEYLALKRRPLAPGPVGARAQDRAGFWLTASEKTFLDLAAAEGMAYHHMAQAIGRDASTVYRYFAKKRRAIMQTGGA
jgi:hypothetical protein